MKDELTEQQIEEILNALNEAIEKGPWDKTNFLKVLGKNLVEVRDGFLNQLGARTQAQMKADTTHAERMVTRSSQREVYISLYSTDGSNIQSWERIVTNLPRQMISRPIYSEEEDVKALLRLKDNKINEAYVAIFVNQSDVLSLSADKTAVDKLGKQLLNLKDKSLFLENVSRFVHISGDYHLDHGRLIKN